MLKVWHADHTLLRCPHLTPLFAACVLWLGLGSLDIARARGAQGEFKTDAERWAWSQIKQGKAADFNEHCGTPVLDPKDEKDRRWQDECRKLPAHFVEDLLTRAPWRDQVPSGGVGITGARIVGDVALGNAKLIRSIEIYGSRIEGAVNLSDARTDSLIALSLSLVAGTFNGENLHSENRLVLRNGAVFKDDVNFSYAEIDGGVDMTGAVFNRTLNADGLQAGDLFMYSDGQNKASFKEVTLRGANIKDQIDMTGASFDGPLNAANLHVERDLYMRSQGGDRASFKEVNLVGAKIAGQIDMTGASFDGPLNAANLHVEGDLYMLSDGQSKASFKDVDLRGATITGNIYMNTAKFNTMTLTGANINGTLDMTGASFEGTFNAGSLHVEGDLYMRSYSQNKASFKEVVLRNAKITGEIDMIGATFDGKLDADKLQVGTSLYVQSDGQNKASFKDVSLRSANIKGQINMKGATFDGKLDAELLQVGRGLQIYADGQNKASFKDVDLASAKIAGQFSMTGVSVDGILTADQLHVDGSLHMGSDGQNKANFKGLVLLTVAQITGQVSMKGASFDGGLGAGHLEVGRDLYLDFANCTGHIGMTFAHIGGNVRLRGATLADLDLSGALVAGDLQLSRPEPAVWKGKNGEPGILNLRNTHIGNLMDGQDAWPEKGHLHLDGFAFNHLGGFAGETGSQMRDRGLEWWDDWARRDSDYSPAPYQQLAAALTNAGDRDAANEIRYLGRVRERETEKRWSTYIWSGLLQYVAGFGIGSYTFRVLWWVIGISLLGALYLKMRVRGVRDGGHGFFWCFGASLSRLLPVIEINKEFSDFFNDPKRERLTGFQSAIFSIIGIIGFVLGAVLVAAVSGLTQNP